jgi:hypothetical protein
MPIRYAEERAKVNHILQLTSLSEEEFEALVPAFETAFVAHMQEWTLEGKPREGRRYSSYANSPLPTPEDRLLFILMYLKQAPTQLAHGVAFGMGQPKANQWIHVLLVALRNALGSLGVVPSRGIVALAELFESQDPQTVATPFFTMAPRDRSSAPKTRLNRPTIIAARKSAIR